MRKYNHFTDSDASPLAKRACEYSGKSPAMWAARDFVLNRGFASDPDGLWRNAKGYVARLEMRLDGAVALIAAPWEAAA